MRFISVLSPLSITSGRWSALNRYWLQGERTNKSGGCPELGPEGTESDERWGRGPGKNEGFWGSGRRSHGAGELRLRG